MDIDDLLGYRRQAQIGAAAFSEGGKWRKISFAISFGIPGPLSENIYSEHVLRFLKPNTENFDWEKSQGGKLNMSDAKGNRPKTTSTWLKH